MADKKKPTFRINVTNPTAEALSAPVKEQKAKEGKNVTPTIKMPQKTSQTVIAEGNGPKSEDANKSLPQVWKEGATKVQAPKFTMPKITERTGQTPYRQATPVTSKTPLFQLWADGAKKKKNKNAEFLDEVKKTQAGILPQKKKKTAPYEAQFDTLGEKWADMGRSIDSGQHVDEFNIVEKYVKNPAFALNGKAEVDAYNEKEYRSCINPNLSEAEIGAYEILLQEIFQKPENEITQEDIAIVRNFFVRMPEYKSYDNEAFISRGMEMDTRLTSAAPELSNVKIHTGIVDDASKPNLPLSYNNVTEESAELYGYKNEYSVLPYEKRQLINYMTPEQQAAYYTILGKYGEEKAEQYLDAIIPDIKDQAEAGLVYEHYKDYGKDHPWLANFKVFEQSFDGAMDEVSNIFDGETDDSIDDFRAGVIITAITAGQQESTDSKFKKTILMGVNGLMQNAPEMIISAIPGMTYVGATVGGLQNLQVNRAQQYLNGTLGADGAVISNIISFGLGAIPLGGWAKTGGKAIVNSILKTGSRSAMRDFLIRTVGDFAVGGLIGGGMSTTQQLVDYYAMGENSPYELSVKAYMSQGMTEDEARSQAFSETLTSIGTASFIGALQAGVSNLPRNIAASAGFIRVGNDVIKTHKGNVAEAAQKLIDDANAMSRKSDSFTNAQKLQARLDGNKKITASMLGIQKTLNKVETARHNAYMAGLTDILGIRFARVGKSDTDNAKIEDGVVYLSLNPDTYEIDTVYHEVAHALEQNPKTRDAFARYKENLRNAPAFEDAIKEMKQRHIDQSKKYNRALLESEVAAEFAINVIREVANGRSRTESVKTLKRVVNGNPQLADRIYRGIRKLRLTMKDANARVYTDDVTGISISYKDLLMTETLFEGMLKDVDPEFYSDMTPMWSLKKNGISPEDIRAIQGLGRKNIKTLTPEELAILFRALGNMYNGFGTNSPFFKLWFGDWRANDRTPITEIKLQRKKTSGENSVTNSDTGIEINVSRIGKKHILNHFHKSDFSQTVVDNLTEITQKAVLLDSYISSKTSESKHDNTLLMHSYYAVVDYQGKKVVVKLFVEEFYNSWNGQIQRRSYDLKKIEAINDADGFGEKNSTPPHASKNASIRSISDLYDFVKTYDKDFVDNSSSKIVNPDGTPMVVYHGTDADFYAFDVSKGRANMDIQGIFFSPDKAEATGYGGNVGAYYLSIKNPADSKTALDAFNQFKGQDNAGVKAREYLIKQGFDGVDFDGEEFIAFFPNQIKSATDNIGTFDKANPDTRFRLKKNNDLGNFGVKIDTELNNLSRGKMSKVWNSLQKKRVEDGVRNAYRSYKDGNTKEGNKALNEAGKIWSASLKKGGSPDAVKDFVKHFKSAFKNQEAKKEAITRRHAANQDRQEYGISMAQLVRKTLKDVGISGNRTNPEDEVVFREAFAKLKAGDEEGAKELLTKQVSEMFRGVTKGFSDRDMDFRKWIQNLSITLAHSEDANLEADNRRLQKISKSKFDPEAKHSGGDDLLMEIKEMFPEFGWRNDDTDTFEEPVTEIVRAYDRVEDNANSPLYSAKEILENTDYVVNKIIEDDYYKNIPAKKETPKHIKQADAKKYNGIKIEDEFRNLEVDNLREVDVIEMSSRVREVADKIIEVIDGTDEGTQKAVAIYEEQAEAFTNNAMQYLVQRGYSSDEQHIFITKAWEIFAEISDRKLNAEKLRAERELVTKYGVTADGTNFDNPNAHTPDSPEVAELKNRISLANKGREKISQVYKNTMHKPFMSDINKTVDERARDFTYEGTNNRQMAEFAVREVKEQGAEAIHYRLVTSDAVTAEDTALAWALCAHYRETGESEKMLEIFEVMQPRWTKAAQGIQGMKLFNMLTLEGQLLHAQKQMNALPEGEMKTRPNYQQLKQEEAIARQKDKISVEEQKAEGVPENEIVRRYYLEEFYRKRNLPFVSEEKYNIVKDGLRALDQAEREYGTGEQIKLDIDGSSDANTGGARKLSFETPEDIVDFIISVGSERGLLRNGRGTRKALLKEYEAVKAEKADDTDIDYGMIMLRDFAANQLFTMLGENMNTRWYTALGKKLGFIQAFNMLSSVSTILKNIIENSVLSPMEMISGNGVGRLADIIISKTKAGGGRRTVGIEYSNKGSFNAGKRRARQARIETDLKMKGVLTDTDSGYNDTTQRVFSGNGKLSRFGVKLERALGYSLTVTDEYQKGIIESTVSHSLEKFVKNGLLTEDEFVEIIAQEIKYRTFQDDTLIGYMLDSFKKNVLNMGKDFGLGDFVVKFTKVPGAVLTRSIEYSNIGYLKAVYEITKANANMKHDGREQWTAAEQRRVAMTIGRATTSTGIMATGATLRRLGIIVGSEINDNDEQEDKKYLDQATKNSGFKLNISALGRLIDGDTGEFKNGDMLIDLTWSGWYPQLAAGASAYETINETGILQYFKSFQVVTDSMEFGVDRITTLPALTGITDIYNNWQYKDGYIDFAVTSATDYALTFMPNMVKRIANAIDPYERDVYHAENAWQTAMYKGLQTLPIPAARNMIPKRVDIFGNEVKGTLGNGFVDVLNEVISPAKVSKYAGDEFTDNLEALFEYNEGVIPQKPRSENNSITIDGVTYKFNLYGKDYEEYSEMLGLTSMKNIKAFMSSEYYKYLSPWEQAQAIANINNDTKNKVAEAWLRMTKNSEPIEDITEFLDSGLDTYKEQAYTMVKINQAQEYAKIAPDVSYVVSVTERVPLTEAEQIKKVSNLETKVVSNNNRIQNLKNGTAYSWEYREDGTKYKLYARNMSPQRLEAEIAEAEHYRDKYTNDIEKVKRGEWTKDVAIEGPWDKLTPDQQTKVLKKIESSPDYVLVSDEKLFENVEYSAEERKAGSREIVVVTDDTELSLTPLKDKSNETRQEGKIVVSNGDYASNSGRSGGGRKSTGRSYTLSSDRRFTFKGTSGNITLFDVFKSVRAKWTSRITPPKFTMPKIRAQKPKFVMPKIKA